VLLDQHREKWRLPKDKTMQEQVLQKFFAKCLFYLAPFFNCTLRFLKGFSKFLFLTTFNAFFFSQE
jgi:hypothetical protein